MRIIAIKTLRGLLAAAPAGGKASACLVCRGQQCRLAAPGRHLGRQPVASLLPNSRAVFKFKGNDYCLVVIVRYTQGLMFVRFVDTHA